MTSEKKDPKKRVEKTASPTTSEEQVPQKTGNEPDLQKTGEKQDPKKRKREKTLFGIQKLKRHKPAKIQAKTKERIYLKDYKKKGFSFVTIAILLGILGGTVALYFWDQNRILNRSLENLKSFSLPSDQEKFSVQTNFNMVALLQQGEKALSFLEKKYTTMTFSQKMATVLMLGEFKSEKASTLLLLALEEGNPRLSHVAALSLGKLQEKAMPALLEKWSQVSQRDKLYLIEALALTKEEKALSKILESLQDKDPLLRQTSVQMLAHFENRKEIVDALWNALLDKERAVGDAAFSVLESLQKKQILNPFAPTLGPKTTRAFLSSGDSEARARLIRLMGLLGPLSSKDAGNFIGLFIEHVRKAFRENSLPEKMAAAYVLGQFQDEELLPEILEKLETDVPMLAENIALSLVAFDNRQIPAQLISRLWSSQPHVQKAVASVLSHYHLYTVKLNLQEKAIASLLSLLQKSTKESVDEIAKALSLYTLEPVDMLVFTPSDFTQWPALVKRLREAPDASLKHIRNQFSESTQKLLAEDVATPTPLAQTLLEEFNRLLASPTLYDAKIFPEEKPWPPGTEIHFRRILLEKVFAGEIRPTPLLGYKDLKDAKELIQRLVPPSLEEKDKTKALDKRDGVSKFLWYLCSGENQKILRSALSEKEISLEAKTSLLSSLNYSLTKTPFYAEEAFRKVVLPERIQKLVGQKSSRATLESNRLLLQLHYPNLISIWE